jgi:two-component system response regulator HupR/HoxA
VAAEISKPCVLVVDDEPLNRDLLKRVLGREFAVEEAEDAVQALEHLERLDGQVALVLCDQLMPGRSGTELAADARQRWPDLVFLLLTGFDDDPDVLRAVQSGLVQQVVSKPWRASSLKALVLKALAP